MTTALAVLCGAIFRRWWGDERPSWAYPGYRATQAVAGIAVLFGLGLLSGEPYWRAGLDAGLAVGFLTLPIKVSLFPSTQLWRFIDERWGAPHLGRMLTGYTAWAEVTQGSAVWAIAIMA